MIKLGDNLLDAFLDFAEVDKNPEAVEDSSTNADDHFPVVAVRPRAGAVVARQVMRGREIRSNAYLVHGRLDLRLDLVALQNILELQFPQIA